MLFEERVKFSRFEQFWNNDEGIVPVNKLELRLKCRRCAKELYSGITPPNLLSERLRCWRAVRLAIEGDNEPAKSRDCRSRATTRGRRPGWSLQVTPLHLQKWSDRSSQDVNAPCGPSVMRDLKDKSSRWSLEDSASRSC